MNSSISNFDRIYRNQFLIFGLFLLVSTVSAGIANCYLAVTLERDVIKKETAESRFWQEKVRPAPVYDVLFLGDSRTYRGINPEIIGSILSKRCYNLGFSSGGLNREIFRLAETKLDPSAAQTAVILGITPLTLSEGAYTNKHYRSLSARKNAASGDNLVSTDTFFRPMSSERFDTLREMRKAEKRTASPKIYYASGWTSIKAPFNRREYDKGLRIYRRRSKTYRFSPESLEELAAAVKDWKKNGVQVFALRPPTSAEMVEIENATYDEALVKKTFSDAGGIWLDFPPDDAYQTYDASHLTTDSSETFSRNLALELQKYLNGSRVRQPAKP